MENLRLKAEKEEEDRKKAEREEAMRAEVTPLEANAQEADGGQHRYVRGYIFLFLGGFLLIREKREWCM